MAGVVMQFAPGSFGWFGRLPGDFRVEGQRGRFFFPITSMVIVGVVLTLLISVNRP